MSIKESFALLRAHWRAVVATVLVAMIAAASYSLLTVPSYTAQAELFLTVENGSSTTELNQGSNYAQQQARNYGALAKREIVLEPVILALGLQSTPSQVGRQITTAVPLNTSLITISVTDRSAERASAIANAVGTSLSNVVTKLVPSRRDGTSPIRLDLVQPASVPGAPSTPSPVLVVLFGALAGLVLGIGGVLVKERVSAKLRTVDQLKQLEGVTVLGSIAYDRRASGRPMLTAQADSPRAEAYRQLRTNLRFLQTDAVHKAFVVTSSVSGEGKTVSAANLATALAAAGTSVCLVEADLRGPHLGAYLGLDGSRGLTSVITGEASLEDALQTWGPDKLSVLLSGDIPPNPSELLGSHQAETVLRGLSDRFDVTIIDCPPLLPVTDAALLAKSFGGAIMVVGAGKVETQEFRRASDSLAAAGVPLLGVVMNFAPPTSTGPYRHTSRPVPQVVWDLPADRNQAAA